MQYTNARGHGTFCITFFSIEKSNEGFDSNTDENTTLSVTYFCKAKLCASSPRGRAFENTDEN